MIAFNTFEQMHPKPLKLIGADAGGNRRSGCIEIGDNFRLAKLPHCHSRDEDAFEQYLAIARHGNRRVQFMAAAGKSTQLFCSLRPAGRLGEKPRAARQCLVRADNKSARLT